jgi:hypothetical protein
VETSRARSTLGGLRKRLSEVVNIVGDLRASFSAAPARDSVRAPGDAPPSVAAEGTPQARSVQGDAGGAHT